MSDMWIFPRSFLINSLCLQFPPRENDIASLSSFFILQLEMTGTVNGVDNVN